jgi:hypothetical protein
MSTQDLEIIVRINVMLISHDNSLRPFKHHINKKIRSFERINSSTFLTLFNNAVTNVKHLVQKFLRGAHRPADRQSVKYLTKKALQNPAQSGSAFVPTQPQYFLPQPYFKAP